MEKGAGEDGGSCEDGEGRACGAVRCSGHEISPCAKPKRQLNRMLDEWAGRSLNK